MPRDRNLPTQPVAGDRIKLKSERITAYQQASKLAGYDFDPYAIREVLRVDPFAPAGGSRLFVDGAPHCFLPRDVTLQWNTDDDRKSMLLAKGWTSDPRTGKWSPP
jgi:hypothetical protein